MTQGTNRTTLPPILFGLLAALTILFLAPAGWAQPEEQGGASDESTTAPAGDGDDETRPPQHVPGFRDLIEGLREQFLQYQQAPPHTEHDRALYDTWMSVLKPRAWRMEERVEDLMEPENWVMDPKTGRYLHLKPEAWRSTVRDLSMLYTEIAGARQQLETVPVDIRPVPVVPGDVPEPETDLEGLDRLQWMEQDFRRRRLAGELSAADEIAFYESFTEDSYDELVRLFGRYASWEEDLESLTETELSIREGLEHYRDNLDIDLMVVRNLVSGLQAVEERRLRRLVGSADLDREEGERAQKLLSDMRLARFAGENHHDDPAVYGQRLRQAWFRVRGDLRDLLEDVSEEEAAGEAAAAASTSSDGG